MDRTIGDGNWYAVSEDTTVGTLTVSGTANLILVDGATLTVDGGIRVEGDNSLNIYGQSAGTGKLVANGSDGCAGIGGRKGADGNGGAGGSGGVVTVYGGMVMAKGGQGGAGIGGGAGGGGAKYGYSIEDDYELFMGGDGGAGGSGCAFTVYGGTVSAQGGSDGAGIGGGAGGGGGVGGDLFGEDEPNPHLLGNGGKGGGGGEVVVKGGTVTATGSRAADIGGGGGGGGKVPGTDGAGATVTIDGGSVRASSIKDQPKNGAGKGLCCVSVEVEKLNVERLNVEGLDGYGTRDIVPIDGRVYLWLPDGTHSFTISDGATTLRYCAIVKGRGVTVEPLSPSGEIGFFVDGADVGKDPRAGWYYDSGVLTFNEGGTYVLSGAALENEVQVQVKTEGVTIVLSNAVVITSGRSALDIGANVSLLMAGDTSYLMTTNGASAVNVAADAALTVDLGPGGDRLESMICAFGSEKNAIGGGGRVTANGGTFFVWSDVPACEKADGIACGEDVVMKAGDDPESVMFAPAPRTWPCVLVAPVCRVRVPAGIAGFASTAVSNQTEEISISKTDGAYNVFNAMLSDDVTIDFTAAEGHEILSGGHIDIPAIANDVTVGSAGYPVPDVRRQLTVTLPTTLEGETYVVTEGGNEVEKVGGGGDDGTSVYPVRSGYDVEIVCTAQEGWRIVSETNVVRFANISESQVLTAADLPQARRIFTVTVPEVENATHELSADDGQMTAVGGSGANTYMILSNVEVTVTFVANDGCRITANGEKAWTLTGDVIFGTTEGFPLPTVKIVPGMAAAPWTVGEGVVAYTNETGKLIITGTGAMDDFASAADVPWDPAAVTAVSVGEGVTKVGANAFAGLAGNVPVLGLTATVWNNSIPARAVPSGAVSGAEPETVRIVDGKVLLGVSVCTNGDVTAATEDWEPAAIEKAEVVDGEAILTVPATAEQGFMLLKSKGAAPSDNNAANKVIEDR